MGLNSLISFCVFLFVYESSCDSTLKGHQWFDEHLVEAGKQEEHKFNETTIALFQLEYLNTVSNVTKQQEWHFGFLHVSIQSMTDYSFKEFRMVCTVLHVLSIFKARFVLLACMACTLKYSHLGLILIILLCMNICKLKTNRLSTIKHTCMYLLLHLSMKYMWELSKLKLGPWGRIGAPSCLLD